MTTNEMATTNGQALPEMLEQVVMSGDLAQLTAAERLGYYGKVCESLGLNPYTKPFQYIRLNGKLTLYASKDCTEQLGQIHNVSYHLSEGQVIDDIYIIKAEAQKEFRVASATGAVSIAGLSGEAKANAFMKAETKACRRATLRLIGLGWLDESETVSIPGAQHVEVNAETGEIIEQQERSALPQGWDFTVAQLKDFLTDGHITPDELVAATVAHPSKNNLKAWASGEDILSFNEMINEITFRVNALRVNANAEAGVYTEDADMVQEPEFLDGIPKVEEPPLGALLDDDDGTVYNDAGLPSRPATGG